MKIKKIRNKLAFNKSTITNLTADAAARIKAGDDETIYPCYMSAPQIICDSIGGYSCAQTLCGCGGGGGGGVRTAGTCFHFDCF